MKQLSFLPEENINPRQPLSVNWNLWHGCPRASAGCLHCYMYRRDESVGKSIKAFGGNVKHVAGNTNSVLR